MAVSLLVGAALLSPPASAQNAGKAQTFLVEGETAAKKGDWKAALAAFEKAHEANPSGPTAVRVAGAPVLRLCMEDAPVPYATEMEKEMVKRASDLVAGVKSMC